jgi:hypothetical protein
MSFTVNNVLLVADQVVEVVSFVALTACVGVGGIVLAILNIRSRARSVAEEVEFGIAASANILVQFVRNTVWQVLLLAEATIQVITQCAGLALVLVEHVDVALIQLLGSTHVIIKVVRQFAFYACVSDTVALATLDEFLSASVNSQIMRAVITL